MSKDHKTDYFVKELLSQAKKDRVFALIKKNQKLITGFFIVIILLSISAATISWYNQKQAEKYSLILHQFLVDQENNEEGISINTLKEAYQSGYPSEIKQIAGLQYSNILLKNNKNDEAMDVLLEINKNKKFDDFVREYAGLVALKILTSRNDKKALSLANRLEKENRILKYYVIEQKGLSLWALGNIDKARDVFDNLSKNPEADEKIKDRAKEKLLIINN